MRSTTLSLSLLVVLLSLPRYSVFPMELAHINVSSHPSVQSKSSCFIEFTTPLHFPNGTDSYKRIITPIGAIKIKGYIHNAQQIVLSFVYSQSVRTKNIAQVSPATTKTKK